MASISISSWGRGLASVFVEVGGGGASLARVVTVVVGVRTGRVFWVTPPLPLVGEVSRAVGGPAPLLWFVRGGKSGVTLELSPALLASPFFSAVGVFALILETLVLSIRYSKTILLKQTIRRFDLKLVFVKERVTRNEHVRSLNSLVEMNLIGSPAVGVVGERGLVVVPSRRLQWSYIWAPEWREEEFGAVWWASGLG